MTRRSLAAALVVSGVSAASAQTELQIIFEISNGTQWSMYAELHNPTSSVVAVIADLGFTFRGTNISNFEYNPAFDSDFFGDATVNVTSSSVDFRGGNTLPPLNNPGGVDSRNPLWIATFDTDFLRGDSFDLVGQVTGAYTGVPFPTILTYQNADGSAGDTPWTCFCVPAPTTATLLGLCACTAMRRRR